MAFHIINFCDLFSVQGYSCVLISADGVETEKSILSRKAMKIYNLKK